MNALLLRPCLQLTPSPTLPPPPCVQVAIPTDAIVIELLSDDEEGDGRDDEGAGVEEVRTAPTPTMGGRDARRRRRKQKRRRSRPGLMDHMPAFPTQSKGTGEYGLFVSIYLLILID